MQSTDRTEFDTLVEQLCAGLGVIPSEARKNAYWKGLQKMSMIQFGRVVEHCLSEEGPDKIPPIPQFWKLWRSIRAQDRGRSERPTEEAPAQTKGLMMVNGMFLQYLARRRLKEVFQGDINMPGRRTACLDLAAWLDRAMGEDLLPDRAERETMFDAAMGRVLDGPAPQAGAENANFG